MQKTQILTYGIEGVLVEHLRALAQTHRYWLREAGRFAACLSALQTSPPRIFVLRLGRDIARDLALLEQVHACLPATATIVIGEADNPVLAGLAWELGATFALFPPMPVERVTEVIQRLARENPA